MSTEINHTERAHALLSASGSQRWISCTPSMRLEQKMIQANPSLEDESSDFAKEGTLAHEFGELELMKSQKQISVAEYNAKLEELRAHRLYTDEMEGFVDDYVSYILELFAEAKQRTPGAVLLIEQKVDFSHIVEDGFGSVDALIIADGILDVADLKFGKGLRVDAEQNTQPMLYGLGTLRAFEMLYDIHTVRLHIIQPRLDHISSWEISVEDLEAFAQEIIVPKAAEAFAGEGDLKAGTHCKYCKAAPRCKALADYSLAKAKKEFMETAVAEGSWDPNLLSDSEMIEMYYATDAISIWIKAVQAHMLSAAIGGKKFPGLKIVEGRSIRKWQDEEAVAKKLTSAGLQKAEIYTSKLIGIGMAEKLLTKPKFNSLMSDLVIKPAGAASLVPASDKRLEMGSLEQAKEDFR